MIIEFTNNAPDYLPKGFRIFCWKIMNGFAYVNGDQMYVAASDEKRPFINKDAVYHLPKDWYELVCYDTAEFDEEETEMAPWFDESLVKQPVMRVFGYPSFETVFIERSELEKTGVALTKINKKFQVRIQKADGTVVYCFEVHKRYLIITPAMAG